jgi:ligand-binding sensor domain-containing protein/class 3 adenylate cyclase
VAILKAIKVFTVLFFFFGSVVSAQEMSIRFEQITTQDGLSQSTINDILQDSRGFLWFATEDGLNRYDGYEFKVYRNDPYDPFSISSNQISSILEDREGGIWVGTKGGGLNKFDREQDRFLRFTSDNADDKSLSHNYITALFQDPIGIILVGTQSGLNILNPRTNEFSIYKEVDDHVNLSTANITTVFLDSNSFIWIGTADDGLYSFDRKTFEIVHYTNQPGNSTSISDDWIVSIYEDKERTLWIGTQSGGLNRFDPMEKEFTAFRASSGDRSSMSNNWVLSMYEDSRGTFWIGTLNGLNILDREKEEFTNFMELNYPVNLSNNSITSLFEDRSGVFWVGTQNGALNKFIRSSSESFTVYQNDPSNANSLSNNNIEAIFEDSDGNVWVGTHGGGVNKLYSSTQEFENFVHDPSDPSSISNDFIYAILEDRNGGVWVGTQDGLNLYDEMSGSFIHFKHDPEDVNTISGNIITTIYEDSRGIIWIGTLNNGLNAYDPTTGAISRFTHSDTNPNTISHNKIWSMFEDEQGIFWVGTHGYGLNRYDRVRGTFTRFTSNPSDETTISDNFINVIRQDADGNLWVGTINGLNKFNPESETFTRYTTADGLPNNVIYGIIVDYRGNLWLSTNNGIADFDPSTGDVRIYDRGDGLPSNEYRFGAFHKGEDGTMYFGGINGIVVFKPDSIRDNPYIPPVVITDFLIFNEYVPISSVGSPLNKSISETEEMEITWRDKVFSFEFSALHFAAPEQNNYRYMMEGFDSDWIEAGNRRYVSYTNLNPGQNYTFKVQASNKDGVWNFEGKEIRIKVLPPPWKTWWAYGIYSIFGASVLIGFINFQIGKERKKKEQVQKYNEELEALVKERTILLENEKEKSDNLLYNMLPKGIADEIKEKGSASPRRYEEVSVLFTDFENFTSTAATMSAKKLVSEVNEIFAEFDAICERYGLEKIKTIGDAYMAVSGLPDEKEDHALLCVQAAKEMHSFVDKRNQSAAVKWKMRIGIHSGSLIAGVVGKKMFTYDIWGSTVILASRMEEVGEIGKINISATTCDFIHEKFECDYRGKVNVEGQGDIDMYFVGEEIKQHA